MSENIYEPPRAFPSIVDAREGASAFYVVSRRKFLALYIATLGLYGIYWFYKNWSLYKQSTGERVMPVLRGVFSIFFIHSLFRFVQEKITREEKSIEWNPSAHATIMVLLILVSNGLDRAAMKSIGSPYVDWISLAILAPLTFTFYRAQGVINLSCDDDEGASNDTFTTANYVWIAIGSVLWGFSLYGLAVG